MPSVRPDGLGQNGTTRQSPFIRSKRVIVDSIAAFDFLSIVAASVLAKWAYVESYLDSEQDIGMYLALGMIGGVIAIMSFRSQELYSPDLLTNFRGQMSRILFGLAMTALVLFGVGYMLKISAQVSRGWMLSWFGISVVFLSLGHLAVAETLRRWTTMGYFARNVAIYGSSEIAEKIIARSSLQGEGIRIFGVFDDLLAGATPRVIVVGGLSDLIRMGQRERIDEVLIALPLSDDRRISNLVAQLSILPADIRLCPDMTAFRIRPMGIASHAGIPVLELARRPLDHWGPIMKAIEDRLLAGLLVVMAAPLCLLIALAIKLDSKGPVLFRQRRHGFNHQIITVLKFRTMHVIEDGALIKQAQQNDARVTAVGRFLRRTSLDELPQLLNVINGEMSLVGPRPHAVAHNEYYATLVEHYANRHKMKPGITGWAQIHGLRGETDTSDKMRKRVEFDLYYIENWSIWLDIKIIALTPFLGLLNKNAY